MSEREPRYFWGQLTEAELDVLTELPEEILPHGSALFCPSRQPADIDLFCRATVFTAIDLVSGKDWKLGGSMSRKTIEEIEAGRQDFAALKKGRLNVILCFNDAFFEKYKLAADVCRLIGGPIHKGDRIRLYRRILYGEAIK